MREDAILLEARRRGEGPSWWGLRGAVPLALALLMTPLAYGWFWSLAQQALTSILRDPQSAGPRAMTLGAAGALALVVPLGLTSLALARLRKRTGRSRRSSEGSPPPSPLTGAVLDGSLSIALLIIGVAVVAWHASEWLAFLDQTLVPVTATMTELAASPLTRWALPASVVVLGVGIVDAALEHRAFVQRTLERARRDPGRYRPQGPSGEVRRAFDAARAAHRRNARSAP